jgi:two-component system OmpR family response regulator
MESFTASKASLHASLLIKSSPIAMRLLLVEDEPDLVTGLLRALRTEGYSVDHATHGKDGLHKALHTDYNLIILDVMLPGLDGWTFLERLRATHSTPVLMLTARDLPADRVRGLNAGADDYLIKPFDLSELLARLRALIRRSARKASALLDLGPVQIDTTARTVTQVGQPIILTAREYVVLHYLALHRGQVVSRTTLYEHLFDENDDTLSNVIDVHIFNLRKKLGKDFIETRRGHGYCLP